MNINEKIKEMSSISELKEIAKYISKEEFLKKVINYNNACPKIINLEDCGDHGICSTTPCYSCWENAIKDIKFKGAVNVEFDWDGFKHNKIVVLCDTEEEAKDFLEECYKRKFCWVSDTIKETFWGEYKDKTCYSNDFNFDNRLGYGTIDFYQKRNYKIIKWEMKSPFIENKLDYDREYNIQEIKDFTENMEFVDNMNIKVRFNNGCMEAWSNTKRKWIECKITRNWLNSKFKLIKKDKKVSFKEAIQAYGKEIYCILDDGETKISYYIESKKSPLLDANIIAITPEEILNGEWYIKED